MDSVILLLFIGRSLSEHIGLRVLSVRVDILPHEVSQNLSRWHVLRLADGDEIVQ